MPSKSPTMGMLKKKASELGIYIQTHFTTLYHSRQHTSFGTARRPRHFQNPLINISITSLQDPSTVELVEEKSWN
ncbi:unnamed protein product [Cyprideis torosa]|uniref:Uncharacterized protein n=1 Tax=Cyprideis torosa TaxID=163714 RepID=A0A7R8ZQ38_9CRUS|nr:unnamed protein product [Cyprideis torosa]CAG0889745.1 unnamed protein product [Cyprideis torosa]